MKLNGFLWSCVYVFVSENYVCIYMKCVRKKEREIEWGSHCCGFIVLCLDLNKCICMCVGQKFHIKRATIDKCLNSMMIMHLKQHNCINHQKLFFPKIRQFISLPILNGSSSTKHFAWLGLHPSILIPLLSVFVTVSATMMCMWSILFLRHRLMFYAMLYVCSVIIIHNHHHHHHVAQRRDGSRLPSCFWDFPIFCA